MVAAETSQNAYMPRLLATEIFAAMRVLYLRVMEYCICFVDSCGCTNVQFIIVIFACFYVCAASVNILSVC